jgi:hypothetical protein
MTAEENMRRFKYKNFEFNKKQYLLLIFTDNGETRIYDCDDAKLDKTKQEHRNSAIFSQQKRIITEKLLEFDTSKLKHSVKEYIECGKTDASQTTRTLGSALFKCLPNDCIVYTYYENNSNTPSNNTPQLIKKSDNESHIVDVLERLSSLFEKNMITEDEFKILKKRIVMKEDN